MRCGILPVALRRALLEPKRKASGSLPYQELSTVVSKRANTQLLTEVVNLTPTILLGITNNPSKGGNPYVEARRLGQLCDMSNPVSYNRPNIEERRGGSGFGRSFGSFVGGLD